MVEGQLKLTRGFYGNIYNGYPVKQLSDKETIQTLPLESSIAEIITRALQSLETGACTTAQFLHLICEEFKLYSITFPLNLSEKEISQMLQDYRLLISQWEQLNEGEILELNLNIDEWADNNG